LDDLL
jgi:hypothetical protein